jgi:hypothetical protein
MKGLFQNETHFLGFTVPPALGAEINLLKVTLYQLFRDKFIGKYKMIRECYRH